MFSILTITRDNLEGLRRTRESLIAQTFRDFEWIVVDGASTDGTDDALAAWQDEIAAMVSAPDDGPYDAMNRGAQLARGEYVLFLNAGDALADGGVLEKLAAMLRQKPVDFLYGDSLEVQPSTQCHPRAMGAGIHGRNEMDPQIAVQFEDDKNKIESRCFYKKARSRRWIWWGMFTHHQAMIFRRDFLAQFSPLYDVNLRVGADLDLVWRVVKRARRIVRANFAICRFAPAGISAVHAMDGRREQMMMRQQYMFCPALINVLIFLAQKFVWWLRQQRPKIYENLRLRKHSTSR